MARLIQEGASTLTGGVVTVASAGNVTGLSVQCKYVRREGKWVRQLHCSCNRPATLGTFAGIRLYREEPDQSLTDQLVADGSAAWNGSNALGETGQTAIPGPKVKYSADGQVVIIDGLDSVKEATSVRVYFNSYNTADVENPLVRANRTGATPSAVVVCNPPAVLGPLGQEYAKVASGLTVATSYTRDRNTGKPTLVIDSSWVKPEDPDFRGIVVKLLRADGVEYQLTGVEPGETASGFVEQIPTSTEHMSVRAYSAGGDPPQVNSYVRLLTPEVEIDVEPVTTMAPLDNVTGFSVSYAYERTSSGQTALKIRPQFVLPDHAAFIEFWAQREDSVWYLLGYPSEVGVQGEVVLFELPSVSATWNFAAVVQDKFNMDRDGNVTTDPAAFPAGTPTYSLTVNPPTTDIPLGPGSGFSVTAAYSSPAANGTRNLLLTPNFTPPTDLAFSEYEFWAKREDGNWYLLGYPARGGATDVATIEKLPATTATWNFLLVPYDANGKNRDGAASTDPASPPSGTLTYSLSIAPVPTGTSGQEYCSLVTLTSATLQYQIVTDGAGTERAEWRVALAWTAPADTRFGGAKVVLKRTAGGTVEFLPGEYTGPSETSFNTRWRSVKAGETYTVYVDSIDRNQNENNIDDSVTPKQTGLTPVSSASSSINGGNIANGSIATVAAFASTLMPPEVVSALPSLPNTNYPSGRLVVLTTDGKLYRNVSGSWSKAVDGADLVANSVTAGSIVAGAIGTSQLSTSEILVGGGSSKPPRFRMVDSLSSDICYIGVATITTPNDFTGIWTKRLKVAPTISSTSPLLEMNGSVLSIVGASISITGGSHTFAVDPSSGFRITLPSLNAVVSVDTSNLKVYNSSVPSTYSTMGQLGFTTQTASGSSNMTAGNIQLNYGGVNTFGIDTSGTYTSVSATAGGVATLPATVAGYLLVWIAGTQRKIPYYA